MGKYIKSKTNYVLKTEHSKTPNGRIYERDYMTISDMDSFSPDESPIYGSSNFKFVVRNGINLKKKHGIGQWLPNCTTGESWTINCLGENTSKESKIILNPNYESVLDFAYYGSAIDLIRASITNIILNFPAEMYFTEREFRVNNSVVGYVIENDFAIDINTESIYTSEFENKLRYFCESYNNYNIINGTGVTEVVSWEVTKGDKIPCDSATGTYKLATVKINGITIYVYLVNGETILVSKDKKAGLRIRPKESFIENFYEKLNDFEKILVNRKTKPLYKAVFNTPYENEQGFFTSKQEYIWPNKYEWNLDITTYAYETYLGRLVQLASFHDEYDSDNIWRSMTHEAIKNLDWTFIREKSNNPEEEVKLDSSRIEAILKIWGRQYDDLKRYTDNISRIGNITYDKKNNASDYFLTDLVTLSGFGSKATNPSMDNSIKTNVLFSGETDGYTSVDANINFLRILKLNSPYLRRMKGTRMGIETMIKLFGFKDEDFTINEDILIAKGKGSTYPNFEKVKTHNENKISFPKSKYATPDPLYGLPLREVSVVSGESIYNYVIPWYNPKAKYDKELYFQMNGGWGKRDKKKVRIPDTTSSITISSTSEYTIYDEDMSNMKFAGRIDGMLSLGSYVVKAKDICYVSDISDIEDRYIHKDSGVTGYNHSHYFVLENEKYLTKLGYITGTTPENSSYGWRNIEVSEYSDEKKITNDGKRVLYLESIIDNTENNAPHFGDGKYDDGKEYIIRMENPFQGAIENGDYYFYSDAQLNDLKSIGYSMVKPYGGHDNKKCWYFSNTNTTSSMRENGAAMDRCKNVTAITPYNPEGGEIYDEAAANSIVNVKTMSLVFNVPEKFLGEYEEYINDKVMFYVKQMIPSTTLLTYKVEKK